MAKSDEDVVEQMAMGFLDDLHYETAKGAEIAHDGEKAERSEKAAFRDVVLEERLRDALFNINPDTPREAVDDAVRQILNLPSPDLTGANRAFQKMLTDGVDVSWRGEEGEKHGRIELLDLETLSNNSWLAVNQFTVVDDRRERRPDVVVFVNGLPLVVIELKSAASENATLRHAFNQLQTYKQQIPNLFVYNVLLIISDGMYARTGTLTSGWDRFMPWRTIDGSDLFREPGETKQTGGKLQPGLKTTLFGMLQHKRLLDYALNFVTFEDSGGHSRDIRKKAAAYHQFHAVNKALECTLFACGINAPADKLYSRFREAEATDPNTLREERERHLMRQFGDRKIGVVWHTQGSGKSLSMLFYAAKVIRHPAMKNPTIVVITDRNDLDEQLFNTFANNHLLLRQRPVQITSRADLRSKLTTSGGGVYFTTIQKFLSENREQALSDRKNIVVIADEAHRSQYGFTDGFALRVHEALPRASFIGFTGTPVESDDKNTRNVFGDYIDTYDIQRAVEDGATVPIYYESRVAQIELNADALPQIDADIEDLTEADEDDEAKQKQRAKWASLEALVGSEQRLELIAADLLEHFDARLQTLDGKAMIVCMSRRICVEMYNLIVKQRPDWHSEDDDKGNIKIVMSGSASDEPEWQTHIRSKSAREAIAQRFKNPEDDLNIVIVRDMWLTGFDCPSLHTMYLDKPMSGHNLMQAIARVNRVFRDKPGGRVVDYIGIADSLRKALITYSEGSSSNAETVHFAEEAVAFFEEKLKDIRSLLEGIDYRALISLTGDKRLQGIADVMEFILHRNDTNTKGESDSEKADVHDGNEDGKKSRKKPFLQGVAELTKAYALAAPDQTVLQYADEVALLQEIRHLLNKSTGSGERSPQDVEMAVRQMISNAVSGTGVKDIFAAAGLNNPDLSVISEEFMEEVRHTDKPNLAFETLRKLLNDEIKVRLRKNVVQARLFSEMLEDAVRRYQIRGVASAELIQELFEMARNMRDARSRGENLGLNDDELAFYDALADNDSAVKIMQQDDLKMIAQELVTAVKRNVSIDWTIRESARAGIRVIVKRLLRKYGYPPDKQEKAAELVLDQAAVLCEDWALE